MSVVIKTRKSKPSTWSTTVMWLVFGLATIFFLVIYGQQLLLEQDLKDRIAVQRAENTTVDDANTRLKSSLLYYQSDKYIEQRAREDLNLRRSDEEVLIPIKQEAVSPSAEENASEVKASGSGPTATTGEVNPAMESPNWLAWLSLFSPPGTSP